MPPPSFIATVVLAAVVLVLAIARIRSQRKLSNAAKSVQSGPTSDVPHSTPRSAGKCPHCGHSAQLASFAVASDSDG